jgi:hypothetical protein
MRRLSTLGTSVFVLLAVTSVAAAQDLPKVKEEPIPAAERQRLRELLDIVQQADRVVALPVQGVGTGLSLESVVAEKPVTVALETGRSLGRRLVRHDWGRMSVKACGFQPGVAFRFYQGDRSAQVLICFMCGEMALDGIDGIYGDKKMLGESDLEAWRHAAQKAFPNREFRSLP